MGQARRVPLRLLWDLEPGPPPLDVAALCAEIRALRFLVVELTSGGPLGETAAQAIPALLPGPCRVSLTAPRAALDAAVGTFHELLVRCASAQDVEDALADRDALQARARHVGISFSAEPGRLGELPAVMALCRDAGVGLNIPMARAAAGGGGFLRGLDGLHHAALNRRGLPMVVHDPFLWRAVDPGAAPQELGCQAGNMMVSITPDFAVWGCPALPRSLGHLTQASLRAILQGGARQELRAALQDLPAACAGCSRSSTCQGGCRGRSLVMDGNLQARDPACPGVEP